MSTSTKNNTPVLCPPFKIETRISFVDRDHGIEVPLGGIDEGNWRPYEFCENEDTLELTVEQLATWLAKSDWFGIPYFESYEEALWFIEGTIQKCRELAELAQAKGGENPKG